MMIEIFTYLLALPFAVYFTALVCALVDEPSPLKPLLRLVLVVCVVLLFLLLTDRNLWLALLAAWLTVLALHVAGFWLMYQRGTGVPIYEDQPPPTPILEEQEEEEKESYPA